MNQADTQFGAGWHQKVLIPKHRLTKMQLKTNDTHVDFGLFDWLGINYFKLIT